MVISFKNLKLQNKFTTLKARYSLFAVLVTTKKLHKWRDR